MNWQKSVRGNIRKNEPLKLHTTFKIGGRVRFFIEPKDADDLKAVLAALKRNKLSFSIIGAGSNILAYDNPINKAVIRLNSDYFKRIELRGSLLEVGAGRLLSGLLGYAKSHGIAGLEFLAGIPGSVGGALVMNAGVSETDASGKISLFDISGLVKKVTVMDHTGKIKVLKRSDIKFEYRSSDLDRYIVLCAQLAVKKSSPSAVSGRITRYLSRRTMTQDLSLPSAGCIFKNPPGESAGKLIDGCGLKGKNIHGASISQKHANFILNYGCARAKDVLQLMDLMKKSVKEKYNITLKPEVRLWK
jgi:UDP-N-acetylmuramate dehydrogenase